MGVGVEVGVRVPVGGGGVYSFHSGGGALPTFWHTMYLLLLKVYPGYV